MNNPMAGYDTSKIVSRLVSAGRSQATNRVAGAVAGAQANLSGVIGGITSGGGNVAKTAADKLKAKLGGITGLGGLGSLGSSLDPASALSGILGGGFGGGSEALINTKLADSIFSAGPLEDLLTADAYGLRDSNILNSIVGKLSGFSTNPLESIRQSGGLGDMFGGLTSLGGLSGFGGNMLSNLGNGSFSIDPKALTDRVVSACGGGRGVLSGLSSGLVSNLVNGVGVPPNIQNVIQTMVGDSLVSVPVSNFSDAQGLLGLINRVTTPLSSSSQTAPFFDLAAESNLLSGIFCEAIRIGVPFAIDAMVTQARSSEAADYALRGNIITAVDYADLATTTLIVERLGVNRVLADVPDAAKRLLQSYRIPLGKTSDDYGDLFTELATVLDSLDPVWGRRRRSGVELIDLSFFNKASNDALKLLATQPEWKEATMLAPSYQGRDLIQTAKNNYPLAAI